MTDSIVFGNNEAGRFAVFGGKTYAPAANGILVTLDNGTESTFWQPTGGQYAIENLAISSKGVLCFTERRLNVSLHFFSLPDLRRLQEVPNVTKVTVQDMSFDEEGEHLFVLCGMPTAEMLVVSASRFGDFTESERVTLNKDVYTTFTCLPSGFLVTSRDRVVGYTAQGGDEHVESFLIETKLSPVTAATADGTTIIYGCEDGNVFRYEPTTVNAVSQPVIRLENNDPVTAIYVAEDRSIYVAGQSGILVQAVFHEGDGSDASVVFRTQMAAPVHRIAALDDSAAALVLGTTVGVMKLDVQEKGGKEEEILSPIRGRFDAEVISCHSIQDGRYVVAVMKSGSFAVVDVSTNVKYYHLPPQEKRKVVLGACVVDDMLVMLCKHTAEVSVYDPLTGSLVTTVPFPSDEARPTRCVSNAAGHLIAFDERCVLFFRSFREEGQPFQLVPCGFFVMDPSMMATSLITTACAFPPVAVDPEAAPDTEVPNNRFVVAGSNGEIYLICVPPASSGADIEHAVDSVLLGIWHADFPLVAMAVCYAEADVVNVLAHSLDKDTKLYVLDMRHGKDSKKSSIRPYYLMRDHESGGCGMALMNDGVTICSAGKDGRIILRDVSPYQKKMTPIPPSKEKRKPVGETVAWHFAGGGVTGVAIAGGKIACVGAAASPKSSGFSAASVLKVLTLTRATSPSTRKVVAMPTNRWWKEVSWVRGAISHDNGREGDDSTAKDGRSEAEIMRTREGIKKELVNLREEWERQIQPFHEIGVGVDDLLLEDDKNRFQEECSDAIFRMREDEYYGLLHNQYMQDVIRKRCCDSMEIPRTKVSSLVAPDLEVHNFHVAKDCRSRLRIAKKLAFIRSIQGKLASTFPENRGERGFSFHSNHAPLRTKEIESPEGVGKTGVDEGSFSDETTESLRDALYAPANVYTTGRARLQIALLKGLVLALKDAFNQQYNLLKQKKQSTLAHIDERTHRCIQILKQLGEITNGGGEANAAVVKKLFSVRVDKEEDPNTLFTVNDEELSEEVRALIPKKQGAIIYSPENEAALKLWMDGLEKDVELVQVTLPVPDYADETRDTFVPLDERTDEQVRSFEEYEKKLKEETEAVETRREALRNELKTLQKLSVTSATDLDSSLTRLSNRRVATAERIDETELQVVQLEQQCLKTHNALRRFAELSRVKSDLLRQVQHLEAATVIRQQTVRSAIYAVEAAEADIHEYSEELREMVPFTDAVHGDKMLRRFTRWKRKFDEGKGEMPNTAKVPEDCPEDLWDAYCTHCETLLSLREKVVAAEANHLREEEALQTLEEERLVPLQANEEAEAEQERIAATLLPELLDTATLYSLHQGQVQDEAGALTSDFATSCLRWTENIQEYNTLILGSASESGVLRDRIVKRRRRMKELEFETRRLNYCLGTLRLELRQLHTLRVTRLMQEWLAGDADVSEEKALAKIDGHIAFVDKNMTAKVRELEKMARRVRSQLAERATENRIVSNDCDTVRSSVRDAMAIQGLVHADGADHAAARAREIYETSELEELARSQQEELIRLKRNVDRLRERTFPSFAVVSKQPM